jgi:hypothetical protein
MIKLPRLPHGWKDQPQLFERYWDEAMRSIESNINALLAIPGIQVAIDAANTAAANANTAADAAVDAAADAARVAALTNSGVSGITITATDSGSNCTITISAHTRVYGDGTSVSVNGGSVTGLAYSTQYYMYYDQPSRLGGAVSYAATTVKLDAAQTGDRHLVGTVTTPAALGTPVSGKYVDLSGLGSIFY